MVLLIVLWFQKEYQESYVKTVKKVLTFYLVFLSGVTSNFIISKNIDPFFYYLLFADIVKLNCVAFHQTM